MEGGFELGGVEGVVWVGGVVVRGIVVVGGMVVGRERGGRRAAEGGGFPGAFGVLGWVAGEADCGR